MKKSHKIKIGKVILDICYFMLGVLVWNIFSFEHWLFHTFERVSLDEIIYHAKSTIEGTNSDMVWNYIVTSVIPATILWVLLFCFSIYLRKKSLHNSLVIMNIMIICLLIGIIGYQAEKRIGLITYIRQLISKDNSDFIAMNYTDPGEVDLIFPDERRNLIYIYLESMEMTYSDQACGGGFAVDYMADLTSLALENECFSGDNESLNGGICLPGTTWTMGAMFGQTSGVPLKIPMNGNQMANQESFFTDMVTLGDILDGEGYNQELLIGSSAAFGGRELYFKEHGNYRIHDYDYAIASHWIPEDYRVFWGYEDRKLFEFAKNDLLQLAAEDIPFNMTLLTVDTHFEDGYICDLCGREFGDNQYANVIACSSSQVHDFVCWIREQEFYENTTIVICGDHITMDSDFCAELNPEYQRRTYTVIVNGAASEKKTTEYREYSTLDMFPTTLAAMGVEIPGNCLGLGVNLYSDERTIVEKYGMEICEQELDRPSNFLDSYANITIDDQFMEYLAEVTHVEMVESEEHKIIFRIERGTMDQLINRLAIKSMKVVVDNSVDGTQNTYEMETQSVPTDPNVFTCEAVTDLPFDDKQNMKVKVYLSIRDYEDYLIDVVGE